MEETTNVIKSVSDGNVTITVERYQELLEKAAEKAPVIINTVQKTAAMAASDNKVFGGLLIGGGMAMSALGGIVYTIGRRQAKKL